MEFFTEFSDKNICHTIKGLETATSCLGDQDATTAPARHMQRQDLQIEPNSCFSDLSDSLNSLNSVKVLFMWCTPILQHFQGKLRLCRGNIFIVIQTYFLHSASAFDGGRSWNLAVLEGSTVADIIFRGLVLQVKSYITVCSWDCRRRKMIHVQYARRVFSNSLPKKSVSTKYLKATKETFRTWLALCHYPLQTQYCSQISAFYTIPTY